MVLSVGNLMDTGCEKHRINAIFHTYLIHLNPIYTELK